MGVECDEQTKDRHFCVIYRIYIKKYRIREIPTLSTNADSRTDINLKRLQDLSFLKKVRSEKFGGNPNFFWGGGHFPPLFFTEGRVGENVVTL